MNFELDIDNILLEDCNSSFMKYFDIQNFTVVCEKNDLNDLNILFTKEFVPVKEMSFDVKLDEKLSICNSDFRKEFDVHNFEVCLNENSSINDFLFEEHFNINQSFDYSIIENLKKDFNSRKILTREERESIPEKESVVFQKNEEFKSFLSPEENLLNNKNFIKEKSFFKIVDPEEYSTRLTVENIKEIENKIQTIQEKYDKLLEKKSQKKEIEEESLNSEVPKIIKSYKKIEGYKDESIDKKLLDIEQKYEDLLQKTKEGYQSQLNKMVNDFSEFRNQINRQMTRMAFISSSAGGGAVNILDMDDLDKSNLSNGYTLSYNSTLKKFEFIDPSSSFDSMYSDLFTITQPDLENGYLDLSFSVDSNYYDISEVQINGLVHYYPLYSFTSSNRLDISNLDLRVDDKVRVVYIKS